MSDRLNEYVIGVLHYISIELNDSMLPAFFRQALYNFVLPDIVFLRLILVQHHFLSYILISTTVST